MKYKRILLKLSGEVLAGSKKTGIDFDRTLEIAKEIKELYHLENVSIVDKAIINNEPYNINYIKDNIIYSIIFQ